MTDGSESGLEETHEGSFTSILGQPGHLPTLMTRGDSWRREAAGKVWSHLFLLML